MMMSVTAQSADYGAFMRNSMSATADLLQSIERDIQESRQLIQSKNTDERALTQLVSSLEEDNNILLARVHSLEHELSSLQKHFAQSNDELYKEFEGKILACNGEIERVVAQCNDINNERTALEEQLRQAESECESATSELRHARQTINSLTAQVDAVGAENAQLRDELLRTSEEVHALQQQHQLTSLQLQQAQLMQRTGPSATRTSSTVNLYSDDDIAGLLQRIRHLEEERIVLAQQSSRNAQKLLNLDRNSSLSPPASTSPASAPPQQSSPQPQQYESPVRLTYVVEQAPRRMDLSPPVAYGAAVHYQATSTRTTNTARSNEQFSGQKTTTDTGTDAAYSNAAAVSPASSRLPTAPYSVAPTSPSMGYTTSSGGGRRFESPESDEGQPYELEDTYVGNTGNTGNHTNSYDNMNQTQHQQVPVQHQAGGSRAVPVQRSPIANTGLYTTDYSFADNSTSAPVSTAYSPSSAGDNHTWRSRLSTYGQAREPLQYNSSTTVDPVPDPKTVYHDVLRSSADVMAEARRTLYNSRSRDPKNAPVATLVTEKAAGGSGQTWSQERAQQVQGQGQRHEQAPAVTNRVRFSSPQQSSHAGDTQPGTTAFSGSSDSYHTPYAKALATSLSRCYDQYDSHLLPPQQQLDTQQDSAADSPDDVPDYIAPYSSRDSAYGANYSATEYNPMEHSLLQHEPALASPVVNRRSSTTTTVSSQGGEMPPFSPSISPVHSPTSPYSPYPENNQVSDQAESTSFVPRGSSYRAERADYRPQANAKPVENDNVYAREGEEDTYPDDFESFDDNVGGYLDDEGSLTRDHRSAHYDSNFHEINDYFERGDDYGGEGDNVDEMGAIEDLEGSMSDNEMNNVFMYDGSSAVDMLAMEHPYESYDLDELSRLDM